MIIFISHVISPYAFCMVTFAHHDNSPYTLGRLIELNHELAELIVRAQESHQRWRNLYAQTQELNERMRNALQIPARQTQQKLKQVRAQR